MQNYKIKSMLEYVAFMQEMNVYKYFEALKTSSYLTACALSFHYEKMLESSNNLFKSENAYLQLPSKFEFLKMKYNGLRKFQINLVNNFPKRCTSLIVQDRFVFNKKDSENHLSELHFKGTPDDFVNKLFSGLIERKPSLKQLEQ